MIFIESLYLETYFHYEFSKQNVTVDPVFIIRY